jgi:hypothetical protein
MTLVVVTLVSRVGPRRKAIRSRRKRFGDGGPADLVYRQIKYDVQAFLSRS